MFDTRALSKLNNVFRIHQPLPLSRHASKKLLDTLTSSFRKNLDREHGWIPDDGAAASVPGTPNPDPERPLRRPTDHHLQAILAHPLFTQPRHHDALTPNSPLRPTDPMIVFDRAVAKGMMTLDSAAGCLHAKHRQLTKANAPSVREAAGQARAGSRVAQWIRTSGQERTLNFMKHQLLVRELTFFLVAEGHERVVWDWLVRVMLSADGGADTEAAQTKARVLLHHFITAKIQLTEEGSLDDAFAAIIQASNLFSSSEKHRSDVFLQAWQNLSWAATVESWQRPKPSESLFDSYLAIADRFGKPLRLDLAHLQVHHPTHPTHQGAVAYLQDYRRGEAVPKTPGPKQGAQVAQQRPVYMGLDAVKLLTDKGESNEAQGILAMLKEKFSLVYDPMPRYGLT